MSNEPGDGVAERGPEPAATGVSAPWERPPRWNQQRLPTRVDDLLARLGPSDGVAGRRKRRRADSSEAPVAASELIAALSSPGPDGPDHDTAPFHPITDREEGATVGPDPEATRTLSSAEVAAVGGAAPALPDGSSTGESTDEMTAVTGAGTSAGTGAGTGGGIVNGALGAGDSTVLLTSIPIPLSPGQAPIRDLAGDDHGHTDVIPKVAAVDVQSIRQSLIRQSANPTVAAGSLGDALPPKAAGETTPPPTTPPPTSAPRRRHGWIFAGRVAVALLAVLLVLTMGLEWQIKQRAENGLEINQVQALNTTDPNIVAPTAGSIGRTAVGGGGGGAAATPGAAAAPPTKLYPVENILLLGSDTRADGNGNATNSNGDQTSAQSDTLMVAHLSADRQHVTILSIPRDTMIPAPTCKSWDYTTGKVSSEDVPISPGQRFHINNAYAVGGPACTVTAIQALTGLKIDRMIGIDFNGFKAMVDALGGITVNVCRPIVDREINTVIPTAGVQVIHGEQALNLVRARNVIGDTQSDLARIRRQQVVLSSILRQVTSAGTLFNPNKLDNFLQAFTKHTFTENVTVNDLVDLAGSLGDLSPGKVTFYTMPTVPSEITEGALEVDETKAPTVFDDLINDLPLPGETATPTPAKSTPSTGTTRSSTTSSSATTSSAPTPQDQLITVPPFGVDVQIYNVTGQAGIGSQVQTSLTGVGFQISDDNVVRPENQTQEKVTVEYSDGNRAAALTLAAAVPGSTLVLTPGLGKAVRLMIGSNYDGRVTAVSVGGQVPSSLRAASSSSSATPTSTTSATSTSTSTSRSTTLQATDLSAVNAGAALCA